MRLWLLALALLCPSVPAAADEPSDLLAIEAESHRQWLRGDRGALAELMADEFRFVVMNGAVERRSDIVASARPRRIEVRGLDVEPGEAAIRGDTAAVISILRLDATAQGRALPERMRVLSVYTREAGRWYLLARSITPILRPPTSD
jgi:ketosteroid isomerase-like protein